MQLTFIGPCASITKPLNKALGGTYITSLTPPCF